MTALITPLSDPPSRADPANFVERSDTFMGELPGFALEANALAEDVNTKKLAVDAALVSAENQVTLAANQVTLATEQKTLALNSANAAALSASNALASENAAADSAAESEASAIQASKLNLGPKAVAPTVDNQGAPLLAGATYYDTVLGKWQVWTGSAWTEGLSSVAGVTSINGQNGAVTGFVTEAGVQTLTNKTLTDPELVLDGSQGLAGQVPVSQGPDLPPVWGQVKTVGYYDYDSRNTLRTLTPSDGDVAIVVGLGMFAFDLGSTEPDDDESCFATASGRWLLEAVSWDLVNDWQLPDFEAQYIGTLYGSAVCTISSVAISSAASFSGVVSGAMPGDIVLASPPAQISTANTWGSYYAYVSAPDTVVVSLVNANPNLAVNINPAVMTTWPIVVIKGN